MDYYTLITKLRRKRAEFDWMLANCHDVYRLSHIINFQLQELSLLQAEADELVRQLEERDDWLTPDYLLSY